MTIRRKTTGIIVASVLGLGVIGVSAIAIRSQVQADTVLPGYATAHLHLEISVCESSTLPVKATFTPNTGKKYYFKGRSFDLSTGLNTIEWYVRKIPGGTYKVNFTSDRGIVAPQTQDVNLQSDIASDPIKYSVLICEPTPIPDTPVATEIPAAITPVAASTAALNSKIPTAGPAASNTPSSIAPPPIPQLPVT